jgi:hypothetical protein
MPTGTVRSLLPLPSTRIVRRPRSSAPVSSPHSSLTRIPVAYSSSRMAPSRRATAPSAGVRSGGGWATSAADEASTSLISWCRSTCGSVRRTLGVPSMAPGSLSSQPRWWANAVNARAAAPRRASVAREAPPECWTASQLRNTGAVSSAAPVTPHWSA